MSCFQHVGQESVRRVFIGKVRETDMGFSSAIFKSEVFGELWLGENGLEGDE